MRLNILILRLMNAGYAQIKLLSHAALCHYYWDILKLNEDV